MPDESERLTRLEARYDDLAKDVQGLLREVGGIDYGNGSHKPLKRRMHDLETDTAAARAANAALQAAQAIRRDGWSRWQKTLVTVFTAIGAFGTVISAIVLVVK